MNQGALYRDSYLSYKVKKMHWKQWNSTICCKMNEIGGYHGEWKKLDVNITYTFLYMNAKMKK